MTRIQFYFSTISSLKVLAILCLLTLSACGGGGVEVTTEFRSDQGIKEGTKIYFEERGVGEVIDIAERDSGSLVTMVIDEDVAPSIDSNAAVVVNRIKPGAPLEIYASASPDILGLKDGQQIKALNSMIELVAWSVGDALQVGTGELAGYVDSFQGYLQGEKFQEDRARVEEGVREMAAVASEAMKSVEHDLAEAMSDIDVTEADLAQAIRELGDELSPLSEEMAKSGTDLMAELDKFTQGLESATAEEQQAGQELIDSLIDTIEKLNDAAERGVERSIDEQVE